MSDSLRLFAYGSLIWRPNFQFEQRARCYVDGYARRFWQASSDHRGTPEAPGRVVTLVEAPGARCWGVCYRVAASERERILRQLNEREQGGYTQSSLPCELSDRTARETVTALAYLARSDNAHFVGPEDPAVTAAVIRSAHGPSGHNAEYALRLAEALLELEVTDDHVFAVANLVSDPDSAFSEH